MHNTEQSFSKGVMELKLKVEVEPEVGIKVKEGILARVGLAMSGLGVQIIQ